MFEDSLLDYGERGKTRKPFTVFVSFVGEIIVLVILALVPLIFTEALPARGLLTFLMAPPPPPPPPPPAAAVKVRVIPKAAPTQEFVQPKSIPRQVAILKEEPPPSVVGGVVGGVAGVAGGAGDVLGGIISAAPPPPPPPPPPAAERIRVGGQVQAAKLVAQPKPAYPPLARQARIQGTVRLEAIISKDGSIENLTVVSGHPLLIQSALAAVSQWRYQPTLLNGVAVEVVTTIDVNFTLGL